MSECIHEITSHSLLYRDAHIKISSMKIVVVTDRKESARCTDGYLFAMYHSQSLTLCNKEETIIFIILLYSIVHSVNHRFLLFKYFHFMRLVNRLLLHS